jgi:hypothetical protein
VNRDPDSGRDVYASDVQQVTLRASVEPWPDWSFHLLAPWLHIRNRASDLPDQNLQGLGDFSLFADWKPWRGRSPDTLFTPAGLGFRAGLKLPTGRAAQEVDVARGPATLLQLGTGTWDPLLGVHYVGRLDDLALLHDTFVKLSLGQGPNGFQPGQEFHTVVGAGYTLWDRVTPNLALSGLFITRDRQDGRELSRTGSAFLFVTPGVSVSLPAGLSLFGSLRVPVFSDTRQSGLGELWSVGVRWVVHW